MELETTRRGYANSLKTEKKESYFGDKVSSVKRFMPLLLNVHLFRVLKLIIKGLRTNS